jgi:hypothetical protein
MYTDFIKTLAIISEKLDEIARIGTDEQGTLPKPYVGGRLDVLLDGTKVGYFEFEDDWVIYVNEPDDGQK